LCHTHRLYISLTSYYDESIYNMCLIWRRRELSLVELSLIELILIKSELI
jgi:hypothetical protein